MKCIALYEVIASLAFIVLWLLLSALLKALENGGRAEEIVAVLLGASVSLCFGVSWLVCLTVGDRPRVTLIEVAGRILIGLLAPAVALVAWFEIAYSIWGC
jgi:hypothetical protein